MCTCLPLSSAFLVAGKTRPEEAVQATMCSLPAEVVKSVEAAAAAAAAAAGGKAAVEVEEDEETSERERKLRLIQEQERLIKVRRG